MWSYLKNLAMRTMLTLVFLAGVSANRSETVAPSTPLVVAASSSTPSSKTAGTIEMTVVSTPALESRLPRGDLVKAQVAAAASLELSTANPAVDQTEIVLFQAIIAQADSTSKRSGPPSQNFRGGGFGRLPDPDLPPSFDINYDNGPADPMAKDPNYDNWQKDADIKLKAEKARSESKEHPLATANPDSYLVICLGGCRPSSDKIVYRVSKTSASAAVIAQRRMETTAAEDASSSSDKKPDEAQQNEVACIAGCYASKDISPALKPRRADLTPKAPSVRVAAISNAGNPAAKDQPDNSVASAHRISAETRSHIEKKPVTNAVATTQTWRTKIAFATKKAARLAALRDRKKYSSASKVSRGRSVKRNAIVTEASGFIF